MNDITYAVRSLGKSRLFTVVALLSLALGIGANVTVFSLVNALAFKPLPYPEADRLADVSEWSATKLCDGCGVGTSLDGFGDWQKAARSFSGMGAYLERPFNVSGTDHAERVGGALVSAQTFDVLRVAPVLGRGFLPEDDRIGAPPVVILSNGIFNRHYDGDRSIIGRQIRINGVATTVIGVMPPNFEFPEFARLWIPITPNAEHASRDARDFGVVARLRPGITVRQADVEMRTIAAGIAGQYPETQAEWTARVSPFRGNFDAMPQSMYAASLGAVAFVLLIVCANVAGLLLARGARRRREIAIRLALGASRARIVRHLVVETLMLSLAGGGLGLLAAMWGVDLFVARYGAEAPFYVSFGIDRITVVYCIGVSLFTGIVSGLVPALRSSNPDVHSVLKDGQTTVQRSRLRGMLVIAEMALAMILLAGATELMKSFVRISTPSGAEADHDLLTGGFEFLDARFRDPAAIRATLNAITDRIAHAPGVHVVATDRTEFIAGFGGHDQVVRVEGKASIAPGVSPRFYHASSPGYFEAVRVPIVAGRGFTKEDRAGSPRVVVISKRMADALWPGEPAIGHRMKLGAADSLPWLTIVGVADDAAGTHRPSTYAYVPADQAPGPQASLLVRADRSPASLIPTVRAAVRAVDRDLPVLNLQTAEQAHRDQYWPYRMYAMAMTAFAAFAILLAAIGLYGVVAYNTAQRTREIGVRIALGADARNVVTLVLGQGARLVVVGVVLGTIGSAILLRVLRDALFGASPVDLPVFAAAGALLFGVAVAAIWLPARRAAAIDPLDALRTE